MSLIVNVQDNAFQSMLISSIETFPSSYLPPEPGKTKSPKNKPNEGEAIGLLFGQRILKPECLVLNVSLAITMQVAKRTPDEVEYSELHYDRIREVTGTFPDLEFLGSWHSHPYPKSEFGNKSTEPTPEDEQTAISSAVSYGNELIEIILGITALNQNSYRDAKVDAHSIASYCGRFKYILSAYTTVGAVDYADDEDDEGDDSFIDDIRAGDAGDEDELDFEGEAGLVPVDRLLCPLAAHGGNIFI